MGLVYTVILQDDFNWNYVNKTKQDAIKKIKKDFKDKANFEPDILAEWYSHIVLNCEKFPIYLDEYKDIILKNCDSAIYWNDSTSYKKEKLK